MTLSPDQHAAEAERLLERIHTDAEDEDFVAEDVTALAVVANVHALLASRPPAVKLTGTVAPDNELVRRAMQGVTGDLLDENKRLWAENERLREELGRFRHVASRLTSEARAFASYHLVAGIWPMGPFKNALADIQSLLANESEDVPVPSTGEIQSVIERSSLGAPDAVAARRRTPQEVRDTIVEAVNQSSDPSYGTALLLRIQRAISDPGGFVDRERHTDGDPDELSVWQAKAVYDALFDADVLRPVPSTGEDQDLPDSARARAGMTVVHKSGSRHMLSHRKEDDSGWWLADKGGVADWILDSDDWQLIFEPVPDEGSKTDEE